MPSLLDLPQELRETIIQHVLCGHRRPPTTPSKSDRVDFQDIEYKAWRHALCGIYHERRSTHCPSNCLWLLLTCRQLAAQTKAVLNHMGSATYVLDISVLDDINLFPTWLSVPHITNRVSTLYVDVRLFGHIISKDIARYQVGDGGRHGIHWSFYALLERFLRYGPVDEKKEKCERPTPSSRSLNFEDHDVTVKGLVLDFKSAEPELSFPPDGVTYRRWLSWNSARDSSGKGIKLEQYTTRPEWLAEFLLSEIRSLLRMGYHTALYGKILYERIGTIRILVDGDLKHEVDLAGELASLQFTSPQHTFGHLDSEVRLCSFREWKKQTLARRDQLGFPVIRLGDQDLV
ncbi:hypothetical protein N7474_003181 [Penicillium riverlandense]|uniref:uncharacterized protein n=1 Tax=Penicillium riverlandense TaxID=1903569 RepID=UPI002547A8CA|nr:uncharacterized protein N7474_003181 [Penicillium riverlandense]KAJ5826043.1 hypothetical protein N7474_003181 [Penicillium riverlandense]